MCFAKVDFSFFLTQDEPEGTGGSIGNDADFKGMWLGHHLAAHEAVFVRYEVEGLLLTGQARDGGTDFDGIVWKRLVFVEQPDPQS